MNAKTIGLPDNVQDYLVRWGVREAPILARLREETASHPRAQMQIAPEQGGAVRDPRRAARRAPMPRDRHVHRLLVARRDAGDAARRPAWCAATSRRSTPPTARRYWAEAGVADRVDLRIAPGGRDAGRAARRGPRRAPSTSRSSTRTSRGYPAYYERCVRARPPGGLITLDNVLWSGASRTRGWTTSTRRRCARSTRRSPATPRVHHVMLAIADGMTLARKR